MSVAIQWTSILRHFLVGVVQHGKRPPDTAIAISIEISLVPVASASGRVLLRALHLLKNEIAFVVTIRSTKVRIDDFVGIKAVDLPQTSATQTASRSSWSWPAARKTWHHLAE